MKKVKTELCHVSEWGLDETAGGKWVLICLEHKFIVQDTNKKRLSGHKKYPAEWCEECMEITKGEIK